MKYLTSLKNKYLSKEICLLRVDFNIQDAELRGSKRELTQNNIHPRILAVLPTIRFLLDKRVKVVILSHRGRPNLKFPISTPALLRNAKRAGNYQLPISKEFTLKLFAKILSKLLKKSVQFIDFNFGTFDISNIKNSPPSSVFLLENLRFLPGEDKNDKKFAKQLASLATFYVNDAFSVSHRKNASVVAITKFLPSYAGLLLEKEIKNLSRIMKNPKKPLVIILGGAKISDKIGVIKNFLKKVKGQGSKVNCFLMGGGVANTFFAAQGLPVGKSLYEKEMISTAKLLLRSRKIILPIDSAVQGKKILDIGPQTIKKYSQIIEKARTIVWNGPMGYIENPKFAKGSKAIAEAILKSRAFAIVGGGETTTLVSNVKGQRSKVFVSTGGGAMLEYLAGKKLPGLEALK